MNSRKQEIMSDRKTLDVILEKYGKDDVLQFLDANFDDDSNINYFDSFVSDDKQDLNKYETIKNFFAEIGFANAIKNINDNINFVNMATNDSSCLSLWNNMVEFYNLLFHTKWGTCGIQFENTDSNNIYKLDLSYPQIYYLTILIMSGIWWKPKNPMDWIDHFIGEGYADVEAYIGTKEPDEYVYYVLKMFFREDIRGTKYIQQYFRNFYKYMFLDNTGYSSMYNPGFGVFWDFCENYVNERDRKTIDQFNRLNALWYDINKETNWEGYEYDHIKNSCHYAPFVFNKYIKSQKI